MTTAVTFDKVSIVFGDSPQSALPLMDQGPSAPRFKPRRGRCLACTTARSRSRKARSSCSWACRARANPRFAGGERPQPRGARLRCSVSDGKAWSISPTPMPTTLRRCARHQIAMVFQQFGLLPWRSVRENVWLGLELAGLSKSERSARAQDQLDLVGLSDWADRKVGELSGGMQQRVGLARAFATDAPILLMDEPFSALDPLIRTHLQDELLELQSKLDRTIIFVSHDLDEAFKIGNRIAIMEGGRIVQCGTPQEIFTNPATDYVADFVAHMNPLGVLCARDVMEPAQDTTTASVGPGATIRDVMQAAQGSEAPVGVVEDGRLLGQITRARIFAKLLDPRGG